jgi:glycosyltransferase involved in cell wall biosynthesis
MAAGRAACRPSGDLTARGFGAILVVNDGSDEKFLGLFEKLALFPRVHVLRQAVNLGKGRALKTGINYFLSELHDVGIRPSLMVNPALLSVHLWSGDGIQYLLRHLVRRHVPFLQGTITKLLKDS